jgi:plasmid stability protein
MSRVPTLYIRNVPAEVYEALKARAKREGRSVNAEALRILADVAEREERATSLTDRLRELSRSIELQPGDPTPEQVVRQGREEWDAQTGVIS